MECLAVIAPMLFTRRGLLLQPPATSFNMRYRAPSERPSILITGFGPFPAVPENATSVLVPRLALMAARRFRSHSVHAEILPTAWSAGPQTAIELIDALQPDVALHFGVSSRARGFEIEAYGRNRRCGSADATGEAHSAGCVVDGAPEHLATNLPAARIVTRLRRLGIPAHLSRDAGTYLCNALLYHSLHAVQRSRRPICNGFIHIPDALARMPRRRRAATPCPLDWSQTLAGALEIVATCIGQPARM